MRERLTTKQAAEILGVSPGRVRQMVLDGTLQAEHFGQNLAIDPVSVEAAKSRKTKPGPSPTLLPTAAPLPPTDPVPAKSTASWRTRKSRTN